MATPNVGILTTAGKALIDKVNSGQAKISFSKIVFSSMDNSQLSDMQVKALTAIAPQEVVVSSPETTLDTNSGETRIRATGTNEKLADGVYVKTYGVFAKDDAGSEILYGVTVSPNPNYFPAYDGVTPQAVTYSYKTVIQETSNITMTNSNDVYASQEDLTEALQPYAKTVDVNQQLDKKVNIADMRKPANEVAGIEEVNAVDAKSLARNLIANSGYMVNLDGWQGESGGNLNLMTHPFYRSGMVKLIQLNNPQTHEAFAVSDWFKVKPNTQYTFQFILFGTINTSSTDVWLIGKGSNATNIIGGYVQSPSRAEMITKTFTTGTFEDAYIRVDNNGTTNSSGCYIAFTEIQLEEGTVAHPWTPSFSDLVHRVADNGDGSIRVNGNSYTPADDSKVLHNSGLSTMPNDNSALVVGNNGDIGLVKQNGTNGALGIGAGNAFRVAQSNNSSIGIADTFHDMFKINGNYQISLGPGAYFTPADDSKVAHLSGSNNFDTVPTVNNNPLLLASSLPSDLARTGSNQEFTGKNTFDVAPIDKTTGNPYITKDGVPSDVARTSQQTNFTAGLQSGGINVATAADLKSVEDAAWRVLDNKYITAFTNYNTSIKVDDNSLFLVKIDKVNKRVYMFFTILGNFVEDSRLYIDLTSIVKNVSFPDDANYELYAVGQSTVDEGSIAGNRICFKIRIYDTTYLSSNYSTYTVNTNKTGRTYSSCFVNYDELV
ncbi:hypothetical protein ACN50E_09360 [Levilactobacillus brevis]|uniref:hypothetical protein n=1 Tax=Levilactobacillus brevis TaxID=1580 RepID=UPI003AFA3BD3